MTEMKVFISFDIKAFVENCIRQHFYDPKGAISRMQSTFTGMSEDTAKGILSGQLEWEVKDSQLFVNESK